MEDFVKISDMIFKINVTIASAWKFFLELLKAWTDIELKFSNEIKS